MTATENRDHDADVRASVDADRRLTTLVAAQRALATPDLDLGELPALVRDWAAALSGADVSMVEVRDGDELVRLSVTSGLDLRIEPRRAIAGAIAGTCLQSGEPVYWMGGETEGVSILETRLGLRSLVAVPMPARPGDDAVGVLTLGSYGRRTAEDYEIPALQILAGMAGAALAQARATTAMAATELRDETLIEHRPGIAVMVFDADLRLQMVDGPGARLWHYAERNVLPGCLLSEIVSAEELKILEPFYRSLLVEAGTLEYHSEPMGLDFHFAGVPLPGPDGNVDQMLVTVMDVTDRKQLDEQLRFAADHDSLTGLLNRRSFQAALDNRAATVARHGPAGALLVLDLDHFKQINDTLGHHAGDELIVALAGVLSRRLRCTDVIARLGGDEFAVILPFASRDQVERVVSDVLAMVRDEVFFAGGHARTVTASIGIAMFDESDLTGPEVLINADLAMRDAKEAGRNCYAIHTPHEAGRPTTSARIASVDRIRHALDHDRFALFAQPIMDLRSRTITRHKVLLRMLDEAGDVISPAKFLGVAEEYGLMGRIDRWVVDRSISTLAAHPDLDLAFEVNLSGASMSDPGLVEFIERRLAAAATVDPARLTFEITETAAVANIGQARALADRLTALGCSFALDDFGAGYGIFYHLKYLPFGDLKIDGEFISNCLTSPTDRIVIDAVVAVARGLGKRTIAEYVGNQATLDFLAEHGVDFGLGDHIGRPEPLDETIERVRFERDSAGVQESALA